MPAGIIEACGGPGVQGAGAIHGGAAVHGGVGIQGGAHTCSWALRITTHAAQCAQMVKPEATNCARCAVVARPIAARWWEFICSLRSAVRAGEPLNHTWAQKGHERGGVAAGSTGAAAGGGGGVGGRAALRRTSRTLFRASRDTFGVFCLPLPPETTNEEEDESEEGEDDEGEEGGWGRARVAASTRP